MKPALPCDAQLSALAHEMGTCCAPMQSFTDETHLNVVVVPYVAQHTCVCALQLEVPQ